MTTKKKKWSTPEEKEAAAHEVWAEFPSHRIKGYWRKCGYDERAKQIRKKRSGGEVRN